MSAVDYVDTFDCTRSLCGAIRRGFATVKHAARVGGTSRRAAENWWDETSTPSAKTLINLMRESDEVLDEVLRLSGRADLAQRIAANRELDEALALLAKARSRTE